ncbi:MAG: helix-turn-helix transcriptional regulator [Alphaproteobacteria bacterium]|nr:helix-turn-helix transcriptional regulator [Alphaproteobacteria bacterium]
MRTDTIPEEQLDRVFHALSDRTRRALVRNLSEAQGTVTALAEPFDMSLNAVSKHLKVLEGAGLIERHNSGRTSVCSLNTASLETAQVWLDQYTEFWNEMLDSFGDHMKRKTDSAAIPPKARK